MKKQKVAIVMDGACSLTPAQGEELGVHIAPVYVNFGDKTYQAGVDLEASEFYSMMQASNKLPTTAQPTAADFIKLYTRLADEVDEIITIVISHHMSATIQSVEMAKEEFSKVPIHIIDSESVSLGFGMMAIAAARAAAQGQDAQSVIHLVENIKQRINVIFTVDTLEYLHKGGRIGGATAFLGSALSIKPILYIKAGRIEPLEMPRSRTRSMSVLLDLLAARVCSSRVHVAILPGNIITETIKVEKQIR